VKICLGGKRESTGRETVNHPVWSSIKTEMHRSVSLVAGPRLGSSVDAAEIK
jgi:hypothetical protein